MQMWSARTGDDDCRQRKGGGRCQFVLLVIVGHNRVLLGLSNFFLTLSFSLPLYLTNHPFLSLIFSVSIYIALVLSSSWFPPPPQFQRPNQHHFGPFLRLYAHTPIYMYIIFVYTSGNMTANFSKHAPFNGPHDTISLWSGSLYESLTFSFAFRHGYTIIIYQCLRCKFSFFSLCCRWFIRLRALQPAALQQQQQQE